MCVKVFGRKINCTFGKEIVKWHSENACVHTNTYVYNFMGLWVCEINRNCGVDSEVGNVKLFIKYNTQMHTRMHIRNTHKLTNTKMESEKSLTQHMKNKQGNIKYVKK